MATQADYALTSICLYREARGEGNTGMTAVACVIRNRVNKRNSTFYAEVVRHLQFSSITAPGDPQLIVYPAESDASWQQAQLIAGNIIDGVVQDITVGSTLYYDDSIAFPKSWDRSKVVATIKIGRLNLFKEIA